MVFFIKNPIFHFSFFYFLFCLILFCHADNSTLTKGQSLNDGQTLISEDESFELGFFSPANSTLRYVGIWYHKIQNQTVIWVANREKPISGLNY